MSGLSPLCEMIIFVLGTWIIFGFEFAFLSPFLSCLLRPWPCFLPPLAPWFAAPPPSWAYRRLAIEVCCSFTPLPTV